MMWLRSGLWVQTLCAAAKTGPGFNTSLSITVPSCFAADARAAIRFSIPLRPEDFGIALRPADR